MFNKTPTPIHTYIKQIPGDASRLVVLSDLVHDFHQTLRVIKRLHHGVERLDDRGRMRPQRHALCDFF